MRENPATRGGPTMRKTIERRPGSRVSLPRGERRSGSRPTSEFALIEAQQ
jgi:hypothetical protein